MSWRQHDVLKGADADVAAAFLWSQVSFKFWTERPLEMSATGKRSKESAALFVLAAVSLALITILSVRKLKQFKYRLINEPGGAMFYGK